MVLDPQSVASPIVHRRLGQDGQLRQVGAWILSVLLVGEVGTGEAFQRRAELICLGHPAAEALAHGDRQVAGQQLRLRSQALCEFPRPRQHLLQRKHLGDCAPPLFDSCAADGVPYVPFFPLGSAFATGNTVLTAPAVVTSAARLGVTPAQVALAWLLQRSPNVLLIPGTSSLSHARENLAAAAVKLDDQALADIG